MDDPRRHTLEQVIVAASLELFGYTKSAAFLLPISTTSPPLYIVAGEAAQIVSMLTISEPEQGGEKEKL